MQKECKSQRGGRYQENKALYINTITACMNSRRQRACTLLTQTNTRCLTSILWFSIKCGFRVPVVLMSGSSLGLFPSSFPSAIFSSSNSNVWHFALACFASFKFTSHYPLRAYLFSKGVDLYRKERICELQAVEGREMLIRIHCMRSNSIFNKGEQRMFDLMLSCK